MSRTVFVLLVLLASCKETKSEVMWAVTVATETLFERSVNAPASQLTAEDEWEREMPDFDFLQYVYLRDRIRGVQIGFVAIRLYRFAGKVSSQEWFYLAELPGLDWLPKTYVVRKRVCSREGAALYCDFNYKIGLSGINDLDDKYAWFSRSYRIRRMDKPVATIQFLFGLPPHDQHYLAPERMQTWYWLDERPEERRDITHLFIVSRNEDTPHWWVVTEGGADVVERPERE